MNDFVDLRDYITIVLRRWWLVVLLALMGASVGYFISQRQERVYRARTSVIVGQSIQAAQLDSRDIQTSQRLATTYAEIARRQPVLEPVIRNLGLDSTWQELRDQVSVALVPDTQLLELTVDARSREEAVLIADEIVQQLILLSPASIQDSEDLSTALFVQQRLQDLRERIGSGQERLDELAIELTEATTSEQSTEIEAEISSLESSIVEWEASHARFLEFAGSEQPVNYITVVDSAHARLSPVRPSTRLLTLMGAVIGGAVAMGIIFLLDFLDNTLKTASDVNQDLGLIPLGTVGHIDGQSVREQMIVAKNPFSPVSESYRMARGNIQSMFIDQPGNTLLVTSPALGDGKTATAVNLAIAMANNGQRTIIVDSDLRRPVLHKVFQVPNNGGLSDNLRDPEPEMNARLHNTEIERLQILTAGQPPPNPSELLGSQRMKQLVTNLISRSDTVIFDSPPAAFISDAAVLSRQVDGVVLVVSSGKTRRDVAKQAIFNLQQAGANILGVVLNRAADGAGGEYQQYAPTAGRFSSAADRLLSVLPGLRVGPLHLVRERPEQGLDNFDTATALDSHAEVKRKRPAGGLQRLLDRQPTRVAGVILLAGAILLLILAYVPGSFLGPLSTNNLAIEILSIAVTVLLIDALNTRQRRRELRARLIRQMGSRHFDVAVTASREMRYHGWGFGEDRSLNGANLEAANLAEADLRNVNLESADLWQANLERTFLWKANLRGAFLRAANLAGAFLNDVTLAGANLLEANLEEADLKEANLEGAQLERANLTGANLEGANLRGANLAGANLEGADLTGAVLEGANLTEAIHATPERLSGTRTLKRAKMADGSSPYEWALRLASERKIDDATFNLLVNLAEGLDEEE